MANSNGDLMDSQLLSENVGFLDNIFEDSYNVLQTSLNSVKEYFNKENNGLLTPISSNKVSRNLNESIQYKSALDQNEERHYKIQNQSNLGSNEAKNNNLYNWGLPPEIEKKYELRGISKMFDWQVACLSNTKVLMECCNLVYSAPTSAGKTLVAEVITIKTILERQKKVIVILPFVSIVREKMFYLQDILSSSGIRVEGFMGSQSPPGGLNAVHVAVCTIEKANSLINRLLDEGSISELGAVIVDELHLLGDPHRGYILELLLTKIKYVSTKYDDTLIQIVGMSATLPNLGLLASWLEAELYITEFRPIPLDEFCLVGTRYYNKNGEHVSSLNQTITPDGDCVLKICLETISEGCSVLIFCMTKNRCENLAQNISSIFYKIGCSGNEIGNVLRNQLDTTKILEVLEQLKNCPVGLDQILKSTISFGIAYHHAGLTFDERDIIEGGFKSGAIRVLIATSTLSSGVNLPARKVIIRSPVFQRQPINILSYKQMIGRAGRMGKDTKGESILICTEAEKKIGFDLMMGALSPVKSCIDTDDKFMRAVLEMIASQIVCTEADLMTYSKCTLLFTQKEHDESHTNLLDKTLKELINYELVRIQNQDDVKLYVATPLGKACLSSSMAPNDGLSLFCELQKARQCIVLETDLHLIYLVTPYSVSNQWGEIDWLHLLTLWESLTRSMKRVGELVGVQESFIIRCLRGGKQPDNSQNKLNIHKRFYTALALQDLVNEVPLSEVSIKFQCARGFLQSLQQAAATFAGMVTAFCRQLGWKNMEMLMSQFQDRLHFGIHSELLELMKLSTLNGVRARSLFDSGFQTISNIALGDVNKIENALHKIVPFQSEKQRDGDEPEDIIKRNKIKNVWITGCCAMTAKEAAEKLILEARKYLQYEMGVSNVKWDEKHSKHPVKVNDIFLSPTSKKPKSSPSKSTDLCFDSTNIKIQNEVLSNKNVNESPNNVTSIKNVDVCYRKDILSPAAYVDKISDFSKNSNELPKYEQTNGLQLKDNVIKHLENDKDIMWDTLNFTDIPYDNATKIRTSEHIISPNVSFIENDDKAILSEDFKNISSFKVMSKDISLFSSEGDNSNIFEDSLPLDLIPSKLLDSEEYKKMHTTKSKDSNDITAVTNTILNEFKSSCIELNDEEDIKLYYEDEKKISEGDSDIEFSTSIDIEEINTQDIKNVPIKQCYVSPYKRNINCCIEGELTNSCKKMKQDSSLLTSRNTPVLNISTQVLKGLSLKKINMKIQNQKINCFILREGDISKNLKIFDNFHDIAVYLDLENKTPHCSNLIGSTIFRTSKTERDINEKSNNITCPIKSITFCCMDMCFLLDMTSLDNKQFVTVKQKLSDLFVRNDIKWKYLSLQSMFEPIKKVFNNVPMPWVDISLVEWLTGSDEKTINFSNLVKQYCEMDLATVSISVNNKENKFNNLEKNKELCLTSWLIWNIAEKMYTVLFQQYSNVRSIIDVEAQVLKILSNSQYYGVTVDKKLASNLLIDVQNSQDALQKKAFKICGYHFNFNSSKDVAKVLGIYKGRKVSTKKSVLTAHNTPISSIIRYWRKLNSILTKTLFPLTEKACIYSEGDRINPSYTLYTCTGRVNMHDPNLQNVPRTFSIPIQYLSLTENEESGDVIEFNCRNIFKAAHGHILVSADYCQLEMRIMTHYSDDPVLKDIMNSNVDVFKSIAASWSGLPENEVDDDLRQKAKQLCYGILYGMGNKTLAQHLDVSEIEAAVFMDTFYKTYPSIRAFTQRVIEDCKKKGYVETLKKRRRYLPDINSLISSKRSAAERQAVNTTIQGSASDIVKTVMCAIDDRISHDRHKTQLFLQMHDELIYEVPLMYKQTFISIMKEAMEGTVRLKVPLPVKVKVGQTWGTLEEIKI